MKKGLWGFIIIFFFQWLHLAAEVAVLPASGVAGRVEPYRILVSNASLTSEGRIQFLFPDSFDLKSFKSVKISIPDDAPKGIKVGGFKVSKQKTEVSFKGSPLALGGPVLFELNKIQNPQQAGPYEIEVILSKPNGGLISRFRASFSISPDAPAKLSILRPREAVVQVGQLAAFSALLEDRFGNPIPAASVEWKTGPGSEGGGTFLGNRLFATRAGPIEILASSGELVSAPLLLNVAAGELASFEVTGTPESTVAGVPFPGSAADSIVVTAKDQFGNTVANFSDTVFFSSDDPLAGLPAPYVFTTGAGRDNGRHAFPGSRFVLKKSGTRRISVSADGKTGRSAEIRVLPNYLADFFFFAPPEVIAGKAFDVTIAGGVDLYGNPASGVVNVTPVLGGGASPSGAVAAFNPVVVVSGGGQAKQTLVSTTPTVLRGTNGYFSAFSDTIRVRPAALGGFSLALLPDTLTAGDTLSDFSVEVKDRFGNRKTDFTGSGYFASSDSRALLLYPAGNPYYFSTADSGRHAFPGRAVQFLTKGIQTFAFGNDSLRSTAVSFLVLPGLPVSFSLSAPPQVAAGSPFDVAVQNAVDGYGNSVSLLVQIGLASGNGISPSGDAPVLPTVSVADGSGEGQAILPKAEKAVLEGTSGSLRFSSDTILVSPAVLEKFEWSLASPQISGVPFAPPATLTAKDRFGNRKDNFDALADSVVLTVQPSGTWEKNVLKKPTDFVSGIADLSALRVTFFGPAGSYIFSATSASGKSGNSLPVEVRSIFVDSFSLAPSNIIRGQNFSIAFRVANQSPGIFVLDGIKLQAGGQSLILSLPTLPDTLAASERRSYSSSRFLPDDFPLGKFPVQLELSGRFDAVFATVKTPVLDSLAVADSLFLRPLAEGLNFERVSKSRPYSFSVKLVNQSGFDVVLDSGSRLIFNGAGSSRFFNIADVTLLPRQSEGSVSFRPDSFPLSSPSGWQRASLALSGRRDGVSHADSFSLGDSIFLEDPSKLYYVAGSLTPSAALLETPLNFRLRLGNSGQATFQPDTLSELILVRGSDSLFGYLQPAPAIPAGAPVELNFWITRMSKVPPKAIFYWKPSVKLTGIENGLAVDSFLTLPDSITLFPQPGLVLDSLWAATPSANRVNSDRSFSIRVRLFNPSAESLSATWLYLKAGTAQLASLLVPFLAPQETVEKSLTVPADSAWLGLVTYQLEVLPGYGTVSFAPAELTQRMNQVTVQRQRRAALELFGQIVAPSPSGVVAADQALTLAVHLRNLGEAPVSAGRVRLKVVPPILTFISDSTVSIGLTQPAVFQLLAQDVVDSGRMVASWVQIPADSNTAGPAVVVTDSVWLPFKILPARVALTVTAREKPGPLLYAGEWSVPFELAFTNIDPTAIHLFLIRKISIGLSGLRAPDELSAFDQAVLSDGVNSATARMEDNHLTFEFSPPVLIGRGETKSFSFSLRPEVLPSVSLRFHTDAELIEAFDSVSGAGAAPALLLKADGRPFEYTSSVFTTAAGSGLAASLLTYPNPFSPPVEKVQIAFRLAAASEVELKIYTLTGELVVERTYAGAGGVNQMEWDGTNGRGEAVKNGVYLAVIRSRTTGETVKQKLAVVR